MAKTYHDALRHFHAILDTFYFNALPCTEKELTDVQVGFRDRDRGARNTLTDVHWMTEKAKEFKMKVNMCFVNYRTAFDFVDQLQLWKVSLF